MRHPEGRFHAIPRRQSSCRIELDEFQIGVMEQGVGDVTGVVEDLSGVFPNYVSVWRAEPEMAVAALRENVLPGVRGKVRANNPRSDISAVGQGEQTDGDRTGRRSAQDRCPSARQAIDINVARNYWEVEKGLVVLGYAFDVLCGRPNGDRAILGRVVSRGREFIRSAVGSDKELTIGVEVVAHVSISAQTSEGRRSVGLRQSEHHVA